MSSTILLPPRAQLCIRYCSNKQQQLPNSPTVHVVPRPYRSQPQGPPLSTPTLSPQPLRTAAATPLLRRPPPRTASLITCQSSQTLLSLAVLALFIRAHAARLRGCSMLRWICSEQAKMLVCSFCALMRLPVLPWMLGPFLLRRTESRQLRFGPAPLVPECR
jgi:hypothetical protein